MLRRMKLSLLRKTLLFTFVSICLDIGYIHNQSKAQSQSILPVILEVPFVASPVKSKGKYHLAYEIHITNFWKKNVILDRVEILDQKTSSLISKIEFVLRMAMAGETLEDKPFDLRAIGVCDTNLYSGV